jgi:hypothetical protein
LFGWGGAAREGEDFCTAASRSKGCEVEVQKEEDRNRRPNYSLVSSLKNAMVRRWWAGTHWPSSLFALLVVVAANTAAQHGHRRQKRPPL